MLVSVVRRQRGIWRVVVDVSWMMTTTTMRYHPVNSSLSAWTWYICTNIITILLFIYNNNNNNNNDDDDDVLRIISFRSKGEEQCQLYVQRDFNFKVATN